MHTIRTFIALEMSLGVESAAAKLIAQLKKTGAKVRWVEDEQLHLTLHFLGDVVNTELMSVCETVQDVAAKIEPFSIDVCGVGAFPRIEQPRAIWLGVDPEGTEQLRNLHFQLRDALDALGVHTDTRKYRPHLTLGRGKQGVPPEFIAALKNYADFHADTMFVDEITVYASFQEGNKPSYDVLGRAELGSQPD